MNIDLDKERAARAEVEQEPKMITFGGKTFALPVEMPYEAAQLWSQREIPNGIKLLLGDESWAEFWALHPTVEDMAVLVDGIGKTYGFGSAGESRASGVSSLSNGKRSRPTSARRTASTSGKRAGGRGN